MKLAIVSLRFQAPGGVESHVEAVATRLARLGDRVTVYTSDLYDEGRWERRTEWPPPPRGVEVRRFPVYKRLIPGLTLPLLPGLMDALTESGCEVIHAHSHRYGHVLQSAAVAQATGIPLIVSTHYHPADRTESTRNRLLLRGQDHLFGWSAYRIARRLVVESTLEAKMVGEFAPSDRIQVVPPGIDLQEWGSPDSPALHGTLSLPDRYFLFAGRIAANKGLPFLFRAVARLPSDECLPLVLVGRDWGERAALEQLATELGISGRVVWLGHLEDRTLYRGVMRGASAFVLPSEWEAFGLVLLEAMAARTPIIATRVGGVGEVVQDGRCGRLVPYGDIADLSDALRENTLHPEHFEGYRRAGETRVPDFDWDRTVDAFRKIYAMAISQ